MKINSEFLWEKNQKETNEDALCICHVNYNKEPLILAAVCDGVGGLPNGENASSLVISNIKRLFYQLPRSSSINLSKLSTLFCRCLFSCHQEINNGGTTLCMVLIYKKKCLIISYGDSRLYIGKNRLKPFTPAHTDKSGKLTHALGIGIFKKPFTSIRHIGRKTVLLLCTDGFYRRTHELITRNKYFAHCSSEEEWLSVLQNIYFVSVNRGEKDNSTAIAIWRES